MYKSNCLAVLYLCKYLFFMFGIIFFTKKTCLYPSRFSRYSTRFDICTAKFALFLSLPSKRSVWWCRNLSHWWFGYIWLDTGAMNNVWKSVASHAMAGNYNQVSWMSEGSNAGVFLLSQQVRNWGKHKPELQLLLGSACFYSTC